MDRSGVLVWDLPVRVFHWLFAGGFVAAAIIAVGLGDDSPLFPYHAIIGLALAFLVALRLVWGLVGTRYARFSAQAFSPRTLVAYLGSAIFGGAKRYVGANPGSAYAALAMVLIVIGLAVTGIMLGQGNESVKDVHEVLTYVMFAVIGAHLLGMVLHRVCHHENIAASMVHGRRYADEADGIRTARPIVALLFVVAVAAWSVALVRNFNPATQTATVPLFGTALQVGDADRNDDGKHGMRQRDQDDD